MEATQFDPADSTAQPLQPLADAVGSGEHPVILLVATAGARQSGWGATSAVALAGRLAALSPKIYLADLDFESPSLHQLVGAPNEEGLADVFFYGASLRHVAHRFSDHRFELISAGAFVPEPAEVLRHNRWTAIANDLGPGAVLLAYVPAEEEGALDLAARAFDAVVLGEPGEIEALRARWPAPAHVIAAYSPVVKAPETQQPPKRADVSPAAGASKAEPTQAAPAAAGRGHEDDADTARSDDEKFEAIRIPRDSAREQLIAEMRQRQRAALTSPPPAVLTEPGAPREVVPADHTAVAGVGAAGAGAGRARGGIRPGSQPAEAPLTEPVLIREREAPHGKGRKVAFWVLSLIVFAALAAGAWVAVRYWLDQKASEALVASKGDPSTTQPVVNAPPPSPEGPLPFSVAVEMHNALSLADERTRALAAEEPGIGFFVAPVLVDSVLYYAVLAGPAADTVAAQAIVTRLLDAGLKTVSTPGDVRHTPLAFHLGEFENRREAEERRRAAFELGIPGYVIEVRTAEGTRFRLYAGAHAGRGESQIMRELLRNAGLPDSLVNRAGISPS